MGGWVLLGLVWSLHLCQAAEEEKSDWRGKKVLWVASYHEGYPWEDGIQRGIEEVLKPTGVVLEIVRLDTKRHPDEAHCKKAAANAKEVFDRFAPDIVIASDDNAQRYVVVPFLANTATPVVFCGVNWDASVYGYPLPNVTGIVEIEYVQELVDALRRHAKNEGKRIGLITADAETDRKACTVINKKFFDEKMQLFFVPRMEVFKDTFLRAQEEADILILWNFNGIKDWDVPPEGVNIAQETQEFIRKYTKIPTGSLLQHMSPYVIYTFGRYPEEQGEYAAKTALRILAGTDPASIPLAYNERVELIVNLPLAQAAGILIPPEVLETARIIGLEEAQ